MKPILRWQYEQLVKELLLLQQHASDPSCPCESEGEMCVRKHLLTIEALSTETVPIESSEDRIRFLNQLTLEAKEFRKKEEKKLCGVEVEPEDLASWAREKRKVLEGYSLVCEVGGETMPDEPRCSLAVAQYKDPHTRESMVAPYYDCPKCDSLKCAIIPDIAFGRYILVCGKEKDGIRNVFTETYRTLPEAEGAVIDWCREMKE